MATVDEVAGEEHLTGSCVTRLVRLSFLAPDIVTKILAGRRDPDLIVTPLMAEPVCRSK